MARFNEILVYVANDTTGEPITFAAALAKRDSAYLTGLCALYGVAMLRKVGRNKPSLANTFVAEEYEKAAAAETRFKDIATAAGVEHGWVLGEGFPMDMINMFGRLQDLVVIGANGPSGFDLDANVVEDLVLTRGQATLLVPRDGKHDPLANHIVVAWNGSREAAAAVKAARPLIAGAKRVTVLDGGARESFASVARLTSTLQPFDIGTHLRRLGPEVAVERFEASDSEAGSAILGQASKLGGDLLLMGAYGRTRLSQWILGGATRHILQDVRMPILMAR